MRAVEQFVHDVRARRATNMSRFSISAPSLPMLLLGCLSHFCLQARRGRARPGCEMDRYDGYERAASSSKIAFACVVSKNEFQNCRSSAGDHWIL